MNSSSFRLKKVMEFIFRLAQLKQKTFRNKMYGQILWTKVFNQYSTHPFLHLTKNLLKRFSMNSVSIKHKWTMVFCKPIKYKQRLMLQHCKLSTTKINLYSASILTINSSLNCNNKNPYRIKLSFYSSKMMRNSVIFHRQTRNNSANRFHTSIIFWILVIK